MRRCRMILPVLAVLLWSAMGEGGVAAPRPSLSFPWAPFQVDSELAPGPSPGTSEGSLPPAWEDLNPLAAIAPDRAETAPSLKVSGSAGNDGPARLALRIGYFQVYLSRFAGSDTKKPPGTTSGEGGGFLDALRTLPGEIKNDPGRAAESLGRIFQPQLNLGIEF